MRAAGCEVIVESLDLPGAVPSAIACDADVLLGATFRGGIMDAEFLAQFPRLRLISKYTIGFDDVDLDVATQRGIAVTHCPTEANWGGVAEGTMAIMLAALKRVRERDRQVKAGGWRTAQLQGVYLGARQDGYKGITVGIIGLGRVGSRFAELLKPWGVRVIANDPYVSREKFLRAGAESMGLAELLSQADVVSLHCDLNAETRGLIGSHELQKMKRSAMLINTARGALVDFDALLTTLKNGRLAQAALDVFPVEPLPMDSRIDELGDKLVLSPHMVAANQGGTLNAAIPWATEVVIQALQGQFPARVVNPEVQQRWCRLFGDKPALVIPASA